MSEGYNVGLSFQAFEVTHSLCVCVLMFVCVFFSLLPPSVCVCAQECLGQISRLYSC